jgi:hypothetical protein
MRERVALDATATIGKTTSTSFPDVQGLLATLACFASSSASGWTPQ